MEKFFYAFVSSPIGPLTIVTSDNALVRLEFGRFDSATPGTHLRPEVELVESAEHTAACARELEEYFAGSRTRFTVPLDLRGTEFQLRCWRALLEIPYGETRSYADMARTVGCPQGFRAVGMANHDNPIAIIVPCHRVIASNGKLGGYGGGLPAKQWLLDLERRGAHTTLFA